MSASASLIPELEDVIQHGSPDKRAKTVKRIANLFVDGAPHFNEDHIGLFDDVLCRLVVEIEAKARAEMAQTLAPLANAPTELMHTARQRRGHRGRGSGADAVAAASRKPTGRTRQDQRPGSSRRHRRPRRHRRGGHRRAGAARRHRSGAQRRRQSVGQAVGGRVLRAGQARRRRRRPGREGRLSGRTFRRTCSATCWCARRRWCSSACWPAAKPETRAEIQRVLDKISKRIRRSRRRRATTPPRCAQCVALHQTGEPRRAGARRLRQRTRNSRRRWPRCRCSAACRSRPPTG